MKNRKKIAEVFTKYGYLDIEAVDPEEDSFVDDYKKLNLELEIIGNTRMAYEVRITGCWSDIKKLIKKWWELSADDIKNFESDFKIL